MPTRIKPHVQEISLAFNPANKRKFILHKDEKGGNVMPKFAISVLEKDEVLDGEKAFAKFLEKEKLDEDTTDTVLGAYRLMTFSKDQLPENFIAKMHKSFPDVFAPLEVPKDEKELRANVEKDLRVALEKEIRTAVEKEMNMSKDEEVKVLSDALEVLQKESDETKKLLVVEKDARRSIELKKELVDSGVPGDLDKMAKDVLEAEKVNPELGQRFLTSFKDLGTVFKASDVLLKEIGSSGSGEDEDSAYNKMTKIAKDKMAANTDLSRADAFAAAAKENPAMYREYNEEHFRRIREAH